MMINPVISAAISPARDTGDEVVRRLTASSARPGTDATSFVARGTGNVLTMLLRLAAIMLACLLVACGDEREDNAVDAREENVVRVGDLSYQAVLFRELNPRVAPDRTLVEPGAADAGEGLYAAFLHVCNDTDEPQPATGQIVLEDAFGQAFRPLRSGVDAELTYQARTLAPGACLPARDSPANETFDGAALVFAVPFDAVQERPLVLVIRPHGGGEAARIQLDL
jgi:hypothetical protein